MAAGARAEGAPAWRTLRWAAWTAGWFLAEVGHGHQGVAPGRESLVGFTGWLAVTVVMLATHAQESYMRSCYELKEKDK